MQVKQLFSEERAVSPVIGVILMVAITVILAAVIGTFVLGLGDSVQQSTPSASFSFDYEEMDDDEYNVTVTHEGGDRFSSGNTQTLEIVSTDTEGERVDTEWLPDPEETVSAGNSHTLGNDTVHVGTGERVRVVWTSPDGSNSATVGSSTAP